MNSTYRKILAAGGTAAVILGLGGTALAVSGSDAPTAAPTGTQQKAKDKHEAKGKRAGKHSVLKRLEHGQFVTKGKDGAVTHTIYRGTVTAVSPTAITVKAADGKTQSFVVTGDTTVRVRTKGKKPTDSSIGSIATGDQVLAAGTGTSTVTAKRVVELAK